MTILIIIIKVCMKVIINNFNNKSLIKPMLGHFSK